MNPRLRVRVSRQAEREIREAAGWWLEHRPAARASFADEIERAFDLIARFPEVGARASDPPLGGIRRVHLARIGYHLLYRPGDSEVLVLGLWHDRRDSRPPG